MKSLMVGMLMISFSASALLGAELAIVGFDSQGRLEWNSPTNNGIYQIETSQSVTGPWYFTSMWTSNDLKESVFAFTNQTSAYTLPGRWTNAYYQVVWVNVPQTFRYYGFDKQGILAVTGLLSVIEYPRSGPLSGWFDFQATGASTNWLGDQIGHHDVTIAWAGVSNKPTVKWPIGATYPMGMVGNFGYKFNGTRATATNFNGVWGGFGDWPPYFNALGTFQAERVP